MNHHRRIYFGKILADLGSQAFHGHFENARDYSSGTGVFIDDKRPHHLYFSITTGSFRFHYNTATGQYTFYEMTSRGQGNPIIEGWDGLSPSQQETFVGELFGFMTFNRMINGTFHDYLNDVCIPPARAS